MTAAEHPDEVVHLPEPASGGDLPHVQRGVLQQTARQLHPQSRHVFGKPAVHVPGENLRDIVSAHAEMFPDQVAGELRAERFFNVNENPFQQVMGVLACSCLGLTQNIRVLLKQCPPDLHDGPAVIECIGESAHQKLHRLPLKSAAMEKLVGIMFLRIIPVPLF